MSFSSLNTLVGFIYLQKKTMKNKFLVIALYLVGVSANAQFTFLNSDGATVESGTTVTYGQGQVGNPAGYYEFFISNETSEAIFLKQNLLVQKMQMALLLKFVLHQCYTAIEVGQKFPNDGTVLL